MFFFSTKIPYVNAVWLVKKNIKKFVTWDQADRIHWCSMMGGHLLTRHPRTFTRRGLCWQKLSDRITQPFSVLLRQDTSRVFTPLPHVWEHWKNIFHTCSVNSFNFRNISLGVVSFICTFYWGFKVIAQKQLLLKHWYRKLFSVYEQNFIIVQNMKIQTRCILPILQMNA